MYHVIYVFGRFTVVGDESKDNAPDCIVKSFNSEAGAWAWIKDNNGKPPAPKYPVIVWERGGSDRCLYPDENPYGFADIDTAREWAEKNLHHYTIQEL
mgnify:CR=1 FL=1